MTSNTLLFLTTFAALFSSTAFTSALPFSFPPCTGRSFQRPVGKREHGSALRRDCTRRRLAGQGTSAKVQPQAAPGALGRELAALEIQRFVLGWTKCHMKEIAAQLQVALARGRLGAQQKVSEVDADFP